MNTNVLRTVGFPGEGEWLSVLFAVTVDFWWLSDGCGLIQYRSQVIVPNVYAMDGREKECSFSSLMVSSVGHHMGDTELDLADLVG